jgi:hypothetical protein
MVGSMIDNLSSPLTERDDENSAIYNTQRLVLTEYAVKNQKGLYGTRQKICRD